MAKVECFCGVGGIGNLGTPDCLDPFNLVVRITIVPTYKDNGERNSIPIADFDENGMLPDGYFNAKLIDVNRDQRHYMVTGLFDDVDMTNTDDNTFTSPNGAMYELLQGVPTFNGKIYEMPPSYSGKLNSAKCGENSVYLWDKNGSAMGQISEDGTELFPLPIQKGSLSSRYQFELNGSPSYVDLKFQLDRTASVDKFLTISSKNISENMLIAQSLIDVTLKEGAGTQSITTLYVDAEYTCYGTASKKGSLQGKVELTDWDVDGINPTAVVEASEGKYELTVANTSPATVTYVENRVSVTRKGFEGNVLTVTY
jgi:hypothetical protein